MMILANVVLFSPMIVICTISINKIPYQFSASIRANSAPICVGAIVGNRSILTLCDCVEKYKRSPNVVTIRVGITTVDSRILEAKQIVCHTRFINDRRTPDKNLAIIKTNAIRFSATVQKVPLPNLRKSTQTLHTNVLKVPLSKPHEKQPFRMLGWMYDKDYYTIATDLGWRAWSGTAQISNPTQCMTTKQMAERFKPEMFCAEFYHRNATDCRADRGTLLVQSLLWGLMSYPFEKCRSSVISVPYVDVSQNIEFIKQAVYGRIK